MNSNTDVVMYKVAALAIFIILAVLIVAISVATVNSGTDNIADASDNYSDTIDSDTGDIAYDQTNDTTADISSQYTADTTAPVENDETADTSTEGTSAPPAEDTNPPSPPVSTPAANVSEELASLLAMYPDTVLKETPDAGQSYLDKIVFLGDSTTYGLKRYKMLSGGFDTLQVWTPKSGTLTLHTVSFATIVYPETGKEITIREAVAAKKPEYLVITLGLNGVSFMDESTFKPEYRNMIKAIQEESPNTKIICQSIFPVARSYSLLKSINNDKIRAANKWILEVANETGTKYLDTYSVMCDSEGWLPENHQNGDGLHPNPDAYKLELDNIRTHAYID